jgi:hypothetical protein
MEEDQPEAEAIAVQGDRILAVGSNDDILGLRTQKTKVINLEGKTLLPGFVDAHTHVFSGKWYLKMTLDELQQLALKNGITALADMYVTPDLLKEMQRFADQGKLRIRTSLYLPYDNGCGVVEPSLGNWYKRHPPTRQPGEMLRIGGLKVVTDGGAMCGVPAASYIDGGGDLWFTQAKLNRIVAEAQALGYQVALHALGDRAVEETQNAIQFALAGKPNTFRHRIEHNAVIRPDLLPRYGEIGIVATIFGYVPACGITTGKWVLPCSGCAWPPEVQPWMWPYRALLDENPGLHVAWHSDFPSWGSINPLSHLYSLVTRNEVAEDGSVCEAPEWLAANKITVQQALRSMSIDGAYALFREEEIGSLKLGKFADLVILSENPLTVRPDMIKDIKVLLTMVGGRVEYCASGHESLCKPSSASGTLATAYPAKEIGLFGALSTLSKAMSLPVSCVRTRHALSESIRL